MGPCKVFLPLLLFWGLSGDSAGYSRGTGAGNLDSFSRGLLEVTNIKKVKLSGFVCGDHLGAHLQSWEVGGGLSTVYWNGGLRTYCGCWIWEMEHGCSSDKVQGVF